MWKWPFARGPSTRNRISSLESLVIDAQGALCTQRPQASGMNPNLIKDIDRYDAPWLTCAIQNILIKAHPPEPWWVKVCDMGLSKRVGNIEESFTVCGTPSFMPPELLDAPKTKSVDPYLADMWCFGETIFQTLTGEGTFRNHLDIGRYYDGYVKFPTTTLNQAGASQPAIDFLVSVMASNPLERLTAEKARNHGWMEADLQSLTEKTASIDLRSQVGSFGSFPTGPFEPLDESTMVSGEWTDTIVDHRAVLP